MISTERKLYYPLLLILSNHNRKTAESLARILNKSGDTLLRMLKDESIDENELIFEAQQYFGTTKVELIIDDSIIKTMYSKYIEGSGDNYDPVSRQTFRSLCTVVAMVSDGKTALPLVRKLWIKKELCHEGFYQTKVKIAQELIGRIIEKLEIKIVLMDGAYATTDMVSWCKKRSIPFEMRFHSNRRIALDQDK